MTARGLPLQLLIALTLCWVLNDRSLASAQSVDDYDPPIYMAPTPAYPSATFAFPSENTAYSSPSFHNEPIVSYVTPNPWPTPVAVDAMPTPYASPSPASEIPTVYPMIVTPTATPMVTVTPVSTWTFTAIETPTTVVTQIATVTPFDPPSATPSATPGTPTPSATPTMTPTSTPTSTPPPLYWHECTYEVVTSFTGLRFNPMTEKWVEEANVMDHTLSGTLRGCGFNPAYPADSQNQYYLTKRVRPDTPKTGIDLRFTYTSQSETCVKTSIVCSTPGAVKGKWYSGKAQCLDTEKNTIIKDYQFCESGGNYAAMRSVEACAPDKPATAKIPLEIGRVEVIIEEDEWGDWMEENIGDWCDLT